MNPERMQILEMLAAGTIDAMDAEQLLEKIISGTKRVEPAGDSPGAVIHLGPTDAPPEAVQDPSKPPTAPLGPLKYLCIVINSHKSDVVNIRIPIDLVRTGLKLSTMIPEEARQRMAEHGVDLGALSGLKGDELIDALRDLKIDVNSGKGDVIKIYCE